MLCLWGTSIAANANPFDIVEASISDLQKSLSKGDITSVQLVQQYLARIEAYDQKNASINAIIRLNPEALRRATELDRERQQGRVRGPLHGIPIILKDNFNTQGLATTGGSVALAGFIPTQDAFQVAKLKQAGAIILAKANMDELARDVNGNSSLGGQTKNPYDLTRNPGGSSAGTAAAVAANFAAAGLGTDTCGSIRIPASFNNLVGFRPSKGISSIDGILPLSHVDDVAGPMVRSVKDAAIIMDAVVGHDLNDPATAAVKNRDFHGFVAGLKTTKVANLRLGRLANFFDGNSYSPVDLVVDRALEQLKAQGVTVIDIDTALFDSLLKELTKPPYATDYQKHMADYFKANPEAGFQSISPFKDQGLYHEFIDQWIPFGQFIESTLSESKRQDQAQWRALLRQAIDQVLASNDLDALLYPSSKHLPAKLGELQLGNNCALSSNSGTPALVLPVGFTDAGLPIGVELLGQAFSDENLLATGYAIEQVLRARRPPTAIPVLNNGNVPAPISFTRRIGTSVEVDFSFDPTRSELHYQTSYLGDGEIYAVCLHKAKQGPVIQCLSGPEGRRMKGKVSLDAIQLGALYDKALYLRVYSPRSLRGETNRRLALP